MWRQAKGTARAPTSLPHPEIAVGTATYLPLLRYLRVSSAGGKSLVIVYIFWGPRLDNEAANAATRNIWGSFSSTVDVRPTADDDHDEWPIW